MEKLFERYGPWAVVAGASEGIGASFSKKLAARGFNLVSARASGGPVSKSSRETLRNLLTASRCALVRSTSASTTRSPPGFTKLTEGLDVGLLIYNAAYSPIGAFIDVEVEEHEKAVAVNVLGPLRVSHYMGRRLAERGKGGIILMSSMSGFQGTAMVANYAATKAYDTVLAEGLWYELGKLGRRRARLHRRGDVDAQLRGVDRSQAEQSVGQPDGAGRGHRAGSARARSARDGHLRSKESHRLRAAHPPLAA